MKTRTHHALSEDYFDRCRLEGVKGSVETPEWLVDEMIDIALKGLVSSQTVQVEQEQLRWLDPCCGAGAFVLGIIRKYLDKAEPGVGVDDLPFITAIDLRSDALNATRVGVEELLCEHGLSLEDYLDSGRLVLEKCDFLKVARDNLTLADAWHDDFDVVIGNPPYVRSRDWSPDQRILVRDAFPQLFRGGCDLYGYFYVAAINVVRCGGVVSFVTPFSFLRVSSARDVRARLYESSRLRSILDLGETGVFSGVALHAGIFTFRKEQGDRRSEWGTFRSAAKQASPSRPSIKWSKGVVEPNAVHGWSFTSVSTSSHKQRFKLQTLSESGIRVYSGIRPGVTEAFLVTDNQRLTFRNIQSLEHIRPIFTAREIHPWRSENHRFWIIDSRVDGGDIGDELMAHLGQFRELLESRPEVGKTAEWHQLRSCSYMDLMAKEKIAFPDISKQQRFSLLPAETLVLDGAFFLDSSNPALLGILNSSFGRGYFEATCPLIGTLGLGGRLRYKKSVLEKFPLPPLWLDGSHNIARLDEVVREVISAGIFSPAIGEHIDALVTAIYDGR